MFSSFGYSLTPSSLLARNMNLSPNAMKPFPYFRTTIGEAWNLEIDEIAKKLANLFKNMNPSLDESHGKEN
jgi:hypothetical protein